jgi:hypothetical protein
VGVASKLVEGAAESEAVGLAGNLSEDSFEGIVEDIELWK